MNAKRLTRAQAIRQELRRELQRKDLLEFVRRRVPGYQAGRFHRLLCETLQDFTAAVERGESPRLMVSTMPRAGKSEIVSKRYPNWHLGLNPGHEVICASYSQDLANKNSRSARAVAIEATDLWPHLQPGEPATVQEWGIKGGGQYKGVGVGTGVTGQGGHLIIVDDPIKDWKEALSKNRRDDIWDWYRSTLYTRLAPGGGVIVMATRWHHDDLTGRLLEEAKNGGDQWQQLILPAVAWDEPPDYDWRQPGEALHPDRYPIEQLDKIKRAVGSRVWEALYQQRPSPDAGAIFKREWFRTHTLNPWSTQWDDSLISVDCAFKGKDDSDPVVMQAWGRIGADYYLLGQVRGTMTFPETVTALLQFRQRHSYVNGVLVEDKANGPAVMALLHDKVPGMIPVNPEGGKEVRAHAVSWCYEAGNVHHPQASWVAEDLEPEMLAFPAGKNDDQVDCVTQALARWTSEEQTGVDAVKSAFGFMDSW